MAGIIQKSCVALLPLWSLKKSFVFFLGGEAGRTHANQQKRTKNLKLKFNKKSCQYNDNCNYNYYFSDNKNKK